MENLSVKNKKILFGIFLMILMVLTSMLAGAIGFHKLGFSDKNLLIISRLLFWICLFLMMAYAMVVEKNAFLIWPETRKDLVFYLINIFIILGIISVGMMVFGFVSYKILHTNNDSSKLKSLIRLFSQNNWLIYLTVITAGVVEELLFRGYLQPRIQQLLKSENWAIILSSLFFAIMHLGYGTVAEFIGPFFIGLVFAFFYAKFRNIKLLIACHIIWDLVAVLLQVHFR